MDLLPRYTRYTNQNFERYLRKEVDWLGDDIRLVLDEYNSSFITYEISGRIYTFKDLSEVLFMILQPEYPGISKVIDIEFHDITIKTKLCKTRCFSHKI